MADDTPTFEIVPQQVSVGQRVAGCREWTVFGTENIAVAYQLAKAASPTVWENLFRQQIDMEEEGPGAWRATIQYGTLGPRDPDDPNSTTWSFEITGQKTHITHSLAHIETYNDTGATGPTFDPDHNGAIGVQDSGNGKQVQGCDVFVPMFSWEETHYVNYDVITPSYVQTLESLVATMNASTFRIWSARELLLLGVSGAKRAQQPVGLTFRFASSRTTANRTIGDITVTEKKGWDYLWVEYEKADDGSGNLTTQPKAVHVERVYDEGDFSALGLADPWS